MTTRNFFMTGRAVERRPAKWTDKSMAAWHAAWEREDFEEMQRIERRARIAYWVGQVGDGLAALAILVAVGAASYALMYLSNIE